MLDAMKRKLNDAGYKLMRGTSSRIDQSGLSLPDELRNQRFEICKSCENFHRSEFCKICSCYMPVKTFMPSASCPAKKWLPINISTLNNSAGDNQ